MLLIRWCYIAMKKMELLKEWGLEKRIFTVIVDNASSIDNMHSILKRQLRRELFCNGEFFHVRCADILNLIVQDGASVIDGAFEKIRESVNYVKASETRENVFPSCMETLGMEAKSLLVFDVSTRWNSNHLILLRAILYKESFCNLSEVETNYQLCPSELEWERAWLICKFLTPFA